MKKNAFLLTVSLFFFFMNSWGTPLPPGPTILNVVSSTGNNQACKGSTIEIQAIVDSTLYLFGQGEVGPKGGNVTFDKGNDNNGWRFLQLAPYDIVLPESLISGFGCSCENVAANNEEQGGGYDNFQAWLSSPCAAEWLHYIDTLHVLGFDDWYIPSLSELNSIFNLASNQGLNNVDAFQDDFYWTSSSADFGNCGQAGGIYQKSMQTGNVTAVDRNSPFGRIRLVRRFSNIPQYLWSTGSTESSIQVANELEGIFEYNVSVSAFFKSIYTFVDGNLVFDRNPYFTVTGNIGINVYSIIESLNETISEGDSILFNGVYLKESGIFSDTLTDSNGCLVVTQLNLQVQPIPLTCRIDVSYCSGDLQQLSLFVDPPSPGNLLSIQWSTGATTPQITLAPDATGTYSVVISDDVQTCSARIKIQNP